MKSTDNLPKWHKETKKAIIERYLRQADSGTELNLIVTKLKGVNRPGACFSKVPKLFGRISGDIILFVSSKLRRLEARNFALIFIFIPFTTYEKTSFTE